MTQETLRERWHSKAKEIGLTGEVIAETMAREAPVVAHTNSTERLETQVTAGASHFDRRDAIQAVAGLATEGMEAAEVERAADAFLASEEVVPLGSGPKGERFTTRRIWELEREALAMAEKMRTDGPDPAGSLVAERAILSRPTLKDDQAEMVRRLLAERSGIAVVIGEAGTGKTFALVAAAEGWAGAGIELRADAPTWRAANVMRAEGLPAQSIASLLAELDRPDSRGLARGSALLVDETGMVGSADLARLIDHANRADAKLVLIGDPEQLSEIEAGGLFRAVAERGEPIYLSEVVRHHFDVEREGAKLIRDGEGAEAIRLYRSEKRVIVAPDAEARREAMVSDWQEAFARGEDVVMVAKRNAEVEQLNALARQRMKESGRLAGAEIEVGGQSFAAGDLLITRVNDRRNAIYNRERWEVAEVDPSNRCVVLRGVDQERTVEVGPDYLSRTNSHSDAPALQHAYAITTYSAQGTTVDRALLAADASMDKQELYVAASRSRGETFIYATPEIRAAEREEIAPAERSGRGELAHIAEASVRDRAQRAAHEVAKLEALPSAELSRRREELLPLVGGEGRAERRHTELQQRIEREADFLASLDEQRTGAAGLSRKLRSRELARIDATEISTKARLAGLREEAASLPPISDQARQELAAIKEVLSARARLTTTAVTLAPPPYVLAELGERPADPAKAKLWDRGVARIERYREKNNVTDRSKALGSEPKDGAARARQQAAARRIAEIQRQLPGREARRGLVRGIGRGFGIGR